MPDLESILAAAITRHYIARPLPPMEQWIRENLTIDPRQSSEYAGRPMDTAMVPHARIVFDFLQDRDARELSMQKSSSASMTSTLIAACLYRIAHQPCNILYLIGNKEEAAKMSRAYWRPWIAQIWGEKAAYGADQNELALNVNGIEIILGSPTAKQLRGKQFGIIIEDESDTLPERLEGDNQPLDVAENERTKNTRRSKIIRICTPALLWNHKRPQDVQPRTRISRHYLLGDRREYRVSCPHCANTAAVQYDHLVTIGPERDLAGALIEDNIRNATVWKCPSCLQTVPEGTQKIQMARSGQWVPTAEKPNKRRWSAWHTDLTSLIGKATWGHIRWEIENARGTADFAGVRRAYLAEPEDLTLEVGPGRDRETILAHCSTYERGTCPIIPWAIFLYVDVQKNCRRLPYLIAASESDGTLHVIDWGEKEEFSDLFLRDHLTGQIHGLITEPIPLVVSPHVWESYLTMLPREARPAVQPSSVYINFAAMDSGHRAKGDPDAPDDGTSEGVYNFCYGTWDAAEGRYLFVPTKGRAGTQLGLHSKSIIDSFATWKNASIPLTHYDDWLYKRLLYNVRLTHPETGPRESANHPRIYFPRREALEADHLNSAPGQSLVSQLLSERLVDGEYRTAAGVSKNGWHWRRQGPNDLGDCLKGITIMHAARIRQYIGQLPAASQPSLPMAA